MSSQLFSKKDRTDILNAINALGNKMDDQFTDIRNQLKNVENQMAQYYPNAAIILTDTSGDDLMSQQK